MVLNGSYLLNFIITTLKQCQCRSLLWYKYEIVPWWWFMKNGAMGPCNMSVWSDKKYDFMSQNVFTKALVKWIFRPSLVPLASRMCFPICQIGFNVLEVSISPTGVPKKNMKILALLMAIIANLYLASLPSFTFPLQTLAPPSGAGGGSVQFTSGRWVLSKWILSLFQTYLLFAHFGEGEGYFHRPPIKHSTVKLSMFLSSSK